MRNAALSVLFMLAAFPAQAGPCEDFQLDLRERGFIARLHLRALSLLDSTVVVERDLQLPIVVNVPSQPCNGDNFALGSELTMVLPGQNLLANISYGVINTTSQPSFINSAAVDVHTTVSAALLHEIGFDEFEPQSGNAFQRLFVLQGALPIRRADDTAWGVAVSGGTRYQVFLSEVRVRLAN